MKLPFYSRSVNEQGQICLPKQYLQELEVSATSAWKVTLEKSRKRIILELI